MSAADATPIAMIEIGSTRHNSVSAAPMNGSSVSTAGHVNVTVASINLA
jgi:hypothetical protein